MKPSGSTRKAGSKNPKVATESKPLKGWVLRKKNELPRLWSDNNTPKKSSDYRQAQRVMGNASDYRQATTNKRDGERNAKSNRAMLSRERDGTVDGRRGKGVCAAQGPTAEA